MSRCFDDIHRAWEATWINGPEEDLEEEDLEEELTDMSDEDLVDMADRGFDPDGQP